MALPPKGDPRRPLALAVRSTRLLGILFLLIGTCSTVPLLMRFTAAGGIPGGMATWIFMIGPLLVYFAPGVLYMITSVFLNRRAQWAIVMGLVVGSIHLLLVLVGVVFAAIAMASFASADDGRSIGVLVMAAVGFLFVAALAQMLYHLSKCFEAIKYAPPDTQYGFEPIVTAQLAPPPPAPAPPSGPTW